MFSFQHGSEHITQVEALKKFSCRENGKENIINLFNHS